MKRKKNHRLSFLLFVFVFVFVGASTSKLTSRGTFFVTSDVYREFFPRKALKDEYLVAERELMAADPSSGEAVMECGLRCSSTPPCRSFALNPLRRRCFLSSLDQCQSPEVLEKKKDFIYYDLRNGFSHTCWDTCMEAGGTCDTCGRPECSGPACGECTQFCWTLAAPARGTKWLWTPDGKFYKSSCDERWQLLWSSGLSQDTPEGVGRLFLRVIVSWESHKNLTMHFDSVSLENDVLSVGLPLDAAAREVAKWWDAPFRGRALSSPTNCRPFFYPSDANLEANGVATYEEQLESLGNVTQRGFAWPTAEEHLRDTKVEAIELWMNVEWDPKD